MSLKENLTVSSNTDVLKGSETYGERLKFQQWNLVLDRSSPRCSTANCIVKAHKITLTCLETPTDVLGLFGFSCSSTSSRPPKVALLPWVPLRSFSGIPPKTCLPLNFEVIGTPGTWCLEVMYVGSSPRRFFPGAVAGLSSSSKSTSSWVSNAPEAVEGRTFLCDFPGGILNAATVRTVLRPVRSRYWKLIGGLVANRPLTTS